MALRSVLPMEPQRRAIRPKASVPIPEVTAEPIALPTFPQTEPLGAELIRSLRALHLLLRSARLYDRQHPRLLQSLDGAYESLRSIVANRNGLEIRVERSGIVVPRLSETPLPDARRTQIPCRRTGHLGATCQSIAIEIRATYQARSAGLVAG